MGDLVFVVKQKTAYEMRISDWSDVCSSDLCGWLRPGHGLPSRCRCSWRGSCLGLRVRWPVPRPPLRAARRLRLVSTATVTPPAGVVDPNPGNNSSTARLVVVQQNDGAGCNAGNEGVSCEIGSASCRERECKEVSNSV